jgi:hypothetical protein
LDKNVLTLNSEELRKDRSAPVDLMGIHVIHSQAEAESKTM